MIALPLITWLHISGAPVEIQAPVIFLKEPISNDKGVLT
jgi:hypothetical protein